MRPLDDSVVLLRGHVCYSDRLRGHEILSVHRKANNFIQSLHPANVILLLSSGELIRLGRDDWRSPRDVGDILVVSS